MPFMTEEQAAAEVDTWKIEFKDLKPALVTRGGLWELYKSKNQQWAASICEMGVSAAAAMLTGATAFNALDLVAGYVSDSLKHAAVDKALEKGIDCIAGSHLVDFENGKDYKLDANKKFATKIASGFLTILVSATGGALTVATGGTTAIVTALAIIVWLGDQEDAMQRKRHTQIIDSMMNNYDSIRQKKLDQINTDHRNDLEKQVMANAFHDLEDAGKVKSYTWRIDNRTIISRHQTSYLQQLLYRMIEIDAQLGKQLWIIDLLEISWTFSEESKALWLAYEQKKGLAQTKIKTRQEESVFDNTRMKAFMKRQVESRVELDAVPTTKAGKKLAHMREQVLSKAVEEDCDIPDGFADEGTLFNH
ncbi:MAG: hypothetical protein M1829_001353 [Trizodia sp. TS-e1964]|nr:MAG: hypothetical protein M1829_001353 [Trizodia sp. TS-e1964]